MINQSRQVKKHKFSASFNAPSDDHYADLKIGMFGDDTASIVKEGKAFVDSLGAEYQPRFKDHINYVDIFGEFTILMKSGNKDKNEKFASKYNTFFEEETKAERQRKKKANGEDFYLKIYATDDSLKFKVFAQLPDFSIKMPKIPDNLKNALKDIDQHIYAKIVVGLDGRELLTSP